ncbi:MAG: alpha/beta hydrolase [Bacteroidetes bacterium]|nr:alpha/beta hydrolase [Bacteroidota bacterium]
MKLIHVFAGILWLALPVLAGSGMQESTAKEGPGEYIYRKAGDKDLKAFVFHPVKAGTKERRAAIVFIHGGGWSQGSPEWAFGRARYYARRGLVAIAVQYRLSDQKSVTPLEAMEDTRAVIQWIRSSANWLGVDPERIVAYGWSAGGHLAASAAVFPDTTTKGIHSVPDALVLVSPALQLEKDSWAKRLVGNRADIASLSPVSHIRKGLPPTLILQGNEDTVTPLEGARLFHDRMKAAGNRCDLQIFPDVGHMFTPKGTPDNGSPRPDPKVQALAVEKIDAFLHDHGFLK